MIVEKREDEPSKERLARLVQAVKYIRTLEGYKEARLLHDYLDEIEELLGELNMEEFDLTEHELQNLRWDAFRREMESCVSAIDRSPIDGSHEQPNKLDRVHRLKEAIAKLEEWLAKNSK